MSLKAFHVFFISLSAATAFFFGWWAGMGLSGILSALVGIFLLVYLFWFIRKSRGMGK